MEADFSGYATKAGVLCSDGRTITSDAFKHQHQLQVPLVWQHGHNDPENVLGHVILEHRGDEHPEGAGVYAYGFFNESAKAAHAHAALEHKDINMMSIWANNLVEKSKQVLHGLIREVSLVLSGANPGAVIQNVTLRHSAVDSEVLEDEAIIYTGLELTLAHADGDDGSSAGETGGADDGKTVIDIYESFTDEQKEVVHYMVGEALEAAKAVADDSAAHSGTTTDDESTTTDTTNTQEGTGTMTHTNVFEGKKGTEGAEGHVLSHSDLLGIIDNAKKPGATLKSALEGYAIQHGIENIGALFPEATAMTTAPEMQMRDTSWVAAVLGAAHKTPFAKVKTWTANLTYEQARAKGYIKGSLKKEQFFSIASRETGPKTVYKKQKLDRDDIIDITDFDVVTWIKGEMRTMLDEELARAILVGDGREVDDEDKIDEDKIRPIATDDDYYTIKVDVNISDTDSSMLEAIEAVILNRQYMKGSGQPTFFTTANFVARAKLLKADGDGRRLYSSINEVAADMGVDKIVEVEILDEYPTIIGILVNMRDYTVGANRGGQVALFDDFDIDYNQYKYLIETRVSGALTKPRSAMVLRSVASGVTAVTAAAPTWDPETWTYTIPVNADVNYVDGITGEAIADGAHVLDEGEYIDVRAIPAAGKMLTAARNVWSYMHPTGEV